MDAAIWAEIRRLALVEAVSKHAIARELRVDPKTVRRALAMEQYVAKRLPPPRPRIIDPYRSRIEDLLARHPSISAVRVRHELGKEGFAGDVTLVRRLLRELRGRAPRAAFLRLTFVPADACQVDWAACGALKVGRATRRLSCFVMVLCFSRALYLEFTLSERLETFLECHERAFRFFGGLTKRAIYDNLRSVVLERAGREVRFNPRFTEFAGHYLIEAAACNPASGWEKGRVERAIQYIRDSFLSGREVTDLDALNAAAARWRDEVANVRTHQVTRRRPLDLLAEEQPLLRPFPAIPADTETVLALKANAQFRLSFDGNLYSVPSRLAHAPLTLRASTRRVRIFDGENLVAEHARSYDRGADVALPDHARALLEKKRRGERDAATRQFLSLGELAEKYLKGLLAADGRASGHVARILILVDRYGAKDVLSALRRASDLRAFGAQYVENIVEQDRRRRRLAAPLPLIIAKAPELAAIELPPPDLALYDRALAVEPHESPAEAPSGAEPSSPTIVTKPKEKEIP